MGKAAAKQNDHIKATDIHIIQPPGPSSPVPVSHAFMGTINGGLSSNVKIEGQAAATVNSTATNQPPHIPIGGTFVKPPTNQARIIKGSSSVRINGQFAARDGDTALTCNDPVDVPVGSVVAVSKVSIGD